MVKLSDIKHKTTINSIKYYNLSSIELSKFKTIDDVRKYIQKLSTEKRKLKKKIEYMFNTYDILTKRIIKNSITIDSKHFDLNILINEVQEDYYYVYVKDLVDLYGYDNLTRKHIKENCITDNIFYDKDRINIAINKIFKN
jgi:hypothetical protein